MGESKWALDKRNKLYKGLYSVKIIRRWPPMTVQKFATSCQLVPVCSHKLHVYHSAISVVQEIYVYVFQFGDSWRKTIHLFQNFLFRSKLLIATFFQETAYPIVQLKLRNEDFSHSLNIFYRRKQWNNNIHRNSILFLSEIELQLSDIIRIIHMIKWYNNRL